MDAAVDKGTGDAWDTAECEALIAQLWTLRSAVLEVASADLVQCFALTRAQVLAEAREVARLGLIPVHEGAARQATASELEQIRQAGLRAVNGSTQQAGK